VNVASFMFDELKHADSIFESELGRVVKALLLPIMNETEKIKFVMLFK